MSQIYFFSSWNTCPLKLAFLTIGMKHTWFLPTNNEQRVTYQKQWRPELPKSWALVSP